MTAYRHDDGAEMVEYKPGRTIRRDVGIRLGLIVPEVSFGRGRSVAFAPAVDPQPEPVAPPPLQPSHEDLVSIAPSLPPVARPLRARPPKRPIAEILAEAARNQRARKVRA